MMAEHRIVASDDGERGSVPLLKNFACLAQRAGKHQLARRAWEKYLAAGPSDPGGHFNLATCLDALGERQAALGCFERAFALQPCMAEAAANAAGILMQTGDAERACSLCYQALEGDPDCAPAAYNLNTALRMVGRQEEAISFSWRVIRGNLENLPGRASAGVIERCVNFSSAATAAEAAAAANAAAPSPRWINHVEGRGVVDPSPVVHGVGSPRLGADKVSRPVGGGGCPEGVAATRGEAADAGSLTVACVRWGDKYGPEYVERLAFGVRRNLSRRYGFVCFTDDVTALNGMVGVEARPLGEGCKGWRGWWHKAFLFSREAGLDGRVLYIDLDTVVSGPLDDLAGYRGPFAALSVEGMANERRPLGVNSSVMSWDTGGDKDVGVIHDLLQEAHSAVMACVYKFDHWLEMVAPGVETLQHLFPGQIVEFKADCCQAVYSVAEDVPHERPPSTLLGIAPDYTPAAAGDAKGDAGVEERSDPGRSSADTRVAVAEPESRLPLNARLVCFPLEPKPHGVDGGWVRRFWRGEGAPLPEPSSGAA